MKKIFFLFAALVACTLSTFAYDFEVNGIYYNFLGGDSVAVTYKGNSYNEYYNTYASSVTIPETVSYNSTIYRVTTIGEHAFNNCSSLTRVTIPSSVTTIDYGAFSNCSSLTTITIPNSVTAIGFAMVSGCSSLETITVEAGNPTYHSTGNCIIETATKTLHTGCKNSIIPTDGSVTFIGWNAFVGCSSLTSITIPNNVISIGRNAFSSSGLTSVTIPESVNTIDAAAFYCCFDLVSVEIPNSVTKIGEFAFYACSSLQSVSIPENITQINENTFGLCVELTSITIPECVTTIAAEAFFNTGLISITIPNNVTTIGNRAFAACFDLETITVSSNNSIYHSAGNCLIETASKTLIVGGSNSVIPSDGTVTSIGDMAFSLNRKLTSIFIPSNITMIDKLAFGPNTKVETIIVDTNNPIYHSAGNCLIETASKTLIVGCKNSTIPTDGSVTAIGYGAFQLCTSLTSIIIPECINTIGSYAFYMCSGLTSITCLAQIPPVIEGELPFYDVDPSISVYVPKLSIESYQTTPHWNHFTNIQAIPTIKSLELRVDKIALYPNEKYFLNTVVAPAEADKNTLIWTSSDMDIATVDSTGFVTAHAVGTATITVATPDNALTANCEVIVLAESQAPSDDVVVDPDTESVDISWTPVEGAAYYVFVVYADENQVTKICTLTFNAWGHLTNIHFQPKKPVAMPEDNPFNFTVTGLEENTTYGYSMSSYDETETVIASKVGQFTTMANVATGVETPLASPDEVSKVLENGTIYILRGGEKYTVDGRKVE